jgi:hypothetical protein
MHVEFLIVDAFGARHEFPAELDDAAWHTLFFANENLACAAAFDLAPHRVFGDIPRRKFGARVRRLAVRDRDGNARLLKGRART